MENKVKVEEVKDVLNNLVSSIEGEDGDFVRYSTHQYNFYLKGKDFCIKDINNEYKVFVKYEFEDEDIIDAYSSDTEFIDVFVLLGVCNSLEDIESLIKNLLTVKKVELTINIF